jgi:ADP-heptose:LPS heptosyltransferase
MSHSTISNKTFLSRICKILSPNLQAAIVRLISPCLHKPDSFHLPSGLTSAKSAVILLSENPGDAAHNADSVHCIAGLLSNAKTTVICESGMADSIKKTNAGLEIFTYEEQNRFLFSREMNALSKALPDKECDVCISLDSNPHIALLHLLSRFSPSIRVGFDNGESDFFFNLRFKRNTASENRCVSRLAPLVAILTRIYGPVPDAEHGLCTKGAVS